MSTAKDEVASTLGRRPLRGNRDFVLLWTAGVTSGLGSRLTLVAYPLLVLALNGTATQAGLLGTAGLITRTILRLPAGALVDRWDRRRVMLWCDSIRVVALLVVVAAVAAGAATIGLLVVAVVVESAGGVFFLPAERAALRSVVPVEHLSSALTINQAREFAAELAGPPLGGVLLGLGRALPFLGDAMSYAYSFVAVLLVRTPLRVARDPDRPTGLRREVTDGVAFTWRNPLLRAIALCVAGANTVYTGLSFAVIVVAHRSGAAPGGIGLMLAAAGVGGLLGALLAPRLIAAVPPGVLVLGVLWCGAVLIPAMAAHPTPALMAPLLAGFTALMPAANAVLISRQMATTPEDMQGRVFTSVLFLSGAAGAVMPVLTGALLGVAGSKAVLLGLGGAMAIVAGLSTANRSLRTVDR